MAPIVMPTTTPTVMVIAECPEDVEACSGVGFELSVLLVLDVLVDADMLVDEVLAGRGNIELEDEPPDSVGCVSIR